MIRHLVGKKIALCPVWLPICGNNRDLFLRFTLEAISKMQITFKDKARADPPSLQKLWRDRRKSGAYTGVCEHFSEVSNAVIER
ncbi:MAG: hypothetical protein ACYS0I_17550 [Planctomycetota bacterium]|jgi:hypothetical protein